MGANVPVMLTSRADDETSRVFSCAVAVLYAHWQATGKSAVPPMPPVSGLQIHDAHVVTLNAGSSSIKFALFELPDQATRMLAARPGGNDPRGAPSARAGIPQGTVMHEEEWQRQRRAFHADALQRVLRRRQRRSPSPTCWRSGIAWCMAACATTSRWWSTRQC